MLIGVTGNIGAGKSTFCAMLKAKGYTVYDADAIGKSLIKKGAPCYLAVVSTFGSSILKEGDEIDTSKLAEIVFSNRAKLKLLTSIVHPEIVKRILQLREFSYGRLVFVECAVIVEYGWQNLFDKMVTIFATRGQRLLRVARRFGLKNALRRDSMQFSYSEKLRHTDYLICNTGNMLHLKVQLDALLSELEGVCA